LAFEKVPAAYLEYQPLANIPFLCFVTFMKDEKNKVCLPV